MQKYLPTRFSPHRQCDSMFLIQTTDVVSELLSKGKCQARMRFHLLFYLTPSLSVTGTAKPTNFFLLVHSYCSGVLDFVKGTFIHFHSVLVQMTMCWGSTSDVKSRPLINVILQGEKQWFRADWWRCKISEQLQEKEDGEGYLQILT